MKTGIYRIWTNRILLALTLLIILTGFGITYPGVTGPLTLGILTKSFSFKLHTFLWGPFLVAALIHIYLAYLPKRTLSSKNQNKDE